MASPRHGRVFGLQTLFSFDNTDLHSINQESFNLIGTLHYLLFVPERIHYTPIYEFLLLIARIWLRRFMLLTPHSDKLFDVFFWSAIYWSFHCIYSLRRDRLTYPIVSRVVILLEFPLWSNGCCYICVSMTCCCVWDVWIVFFVQAEHLQFFSGFSFHHVYDGGWCYILSQWGADTLSLLFSDFVCSLFLLHIVLRVVRTARIYAAMCVCMCVCQYVYV